MKKILAVVLAALMVVGVPAVYAVVNEPYTDFCWECGEPTTWDNVENMYITYYDKYSHLVSFYLHPTCTSCYLQYEGEFITDSLEPHSVDENGYCSGCRTNP